MPYQHSIVRTLLNLPSFFPHCTSIYTSSTMLLLLVLVHLVSKNGSAVPVALSLDPRSSPDSCDDINNCRKLFDIVWGCLATIFACTWVSVHPNVPPPDQSGLVLFWRRLKMMLIGIIAPEIMVGFAARQFFGARMLRKEFRFSRTHAFFFCMGGFVSSTGYPVATKEQLEDSDLGPEFLKAIRNVNAEDIKDKSMGDALSKGVALAQGIWFITQCLARVHQHLVVTELEVATLAFAVVNVFIWLLWWDKPLDVQRQIVVVVGPAGSQDAQPTSPVPMSRFDRFRYAVVGTNDDDDDPLSSTSPSFWSLPVYNHFQRGTAGITALAGSLFGAIHCAAWETDFPTAAEMWSWKSSSLVIIAVPVAAFLVFVLGIHLNKTDFQKTKLGNAIIITAGIVFLASFPIYIVARLILIVLPLMALRSLPSSAFVDVNWSTYIPHI
ncbi:hypothetical protein MVEN_00936300 [Mycena venus]|uniref:Uncharacterized protein n=1 Tax=Mycena venus TaxID=2733690 RepID=A0A8H7CZL3_9AGAR|nr:hypothetical protein MVEN_00936300 [Mycena venus]